MNHRLLTLLLLLTTFLPALAADDPAAAYAAYFNAMKEATSVSQLAPHLTKAKADEIASTPEAEQAMMLEMIKSFSPEDYSIVNQEVTGDIAILHLSVPSDESTTGTATLLKQGGAWKIDKVSWSSKVE
jgi:3-keto-L-gulonate-6-phosphate decarboxylase